MRSLTLFAVSLAALTALQLAAAPVKPLVAFEAINNKSDNKTAKMESFPAAVMDRIVNSRRFDVCKTIADLKRLQKERLASKTDKGAYLIRMTVLQYSFINKKLVQGRRMVIHGEAKVVAQLEFSDARTGKVLESKRAQAIKYQKDYSSADYARVEHTFRLKTMEEAVQAIANECADRFMEMVFPVKFIRISGTSVYINAGQDRVAPGEMFNVYLLGEAFIDPDTGENLGAEEKYVAQVQVVQAKQRYSVGSITTGAVTGDRSKYILRKCSTEKIASPPAAATAPASSNVQIDAHGANPF